MGLPFACVLAATIGLGAGKEEVGNWPIYHGDPGLRGVSSVPLPEALAEKWRYRLGAPAVLPPVVAGNRIFVVVEDGRLLAVGRWGETLWSVSLGNPSPASTNVKECFSTPPLSVAGTVVVGTDRGVLYAYDAATGALRWKQQVGDDLLGSPNWNPAEADRGGGVLVMSRNDGVLKLLNLESGAVVWAAAPVSRCDSPPAVGVGVSVFGACDSAIHIVSMRGGRSLGTLELMERGPIAGGAAVDGSAAFVGTRDGSVVCLDIPSTRITWATRCASNEVFTTPAVTSNRIVVGSNDGRVYCLNRSDGVVLWRATTEGNPSSPVVAGDQVIVTSDGKLFILNLQDGKPVWVGKVADALTSPAVSGNEVIVGTDDGFLILYGPQTREKP